METEYWYQRIVLAEMTKAPSCGVGAFVKGNILLVGERPSNPDINPLVPEQPFCSSIGCSGWLNKLLEAEKIDESKLFWINAFLKDGSPVDITSIIETMQPSAVIALGSVAKEACHTAGVDYYGAYHPQYWKRFKSKMKYPLLELLAFLQINIPEGNIGIRYK